MRYSTFVLSTIALTLLSAVVNAATLYRWVDEQGRVHYSDKPQEGAAEVNVKPAPSINIRPRPAIRGAQPAQSESPVPNPLTYEAVRIANPSADQVLWNLGSVLTVTIEVLPALHEGHRVAVRFNGQPVSDWPARATSYQVNEVYRGTHTVSVEIVDADGKVMIAGAPVTFHVKQTSVLN